MVFIKIFLKNIMASATDIGGDKENQDLEFYFEKNGVRLFGVLDGHGKVKPFFVFFFILNKM